MAKMSRDKGVRGERQVIDILQPVVTEVFANCGHEVPRLQRNTLACDGGGCDVHGLDWIALEVKRQETIKLEQWWAQTLEQAGQTREPVLFYRSNNEAWKVCMWGALLCPVAEDVGLVGLSRTWWRVRVQVDVETFLRWFRTRLVAELEDLN